MVQQADKFGPIETALDFHHEVDPVGEDQRELALRVHQPGVGRVEDDAIDRYRPRSVGAEDLSLDHLLLRREELLEERAERSFAMVSDLLGRTPTERRGPMEVVPETPRLERERVPERALRLRGSVSLGRC